MVCFSTRRLPWRNNLATFRYYVSSRRVEESPRHAPAPLPGRGTAPTRPQQKLPSATRHAVPGLGHLTYLSRFRRQPRICPSCWQDTEQRRGGLQQGFCLTLGACSHCRDTLLFQRQFCKARACAAKWLLGSKKPLKPNPPKALLRFSFPPSDALSAGFSSSWQRANGPCPERRWPKRGHGTSGAARTTLDAQPRQKRR